MTDPKRINVGPSLECVVCHRTKRRVGRSVPLEMETMLCGGIGKAS